jgi:hypothetical protein
MKRLAFAVPLVLLAACAVEPPKSPMERHARLAAAAELAAKNCGGYIGGYSAAQDLRNDANQNIVTARKLGATDADLQKARTDVQAAFNTAAAFGTPQSACNELVSMIAWHSS